MVARWRNVAKAFAGLQQFIVIKPLVAQTFSLKEIGLAQEQFLAKKFTGKLVLFPPA